MFVDWHGVMSSEYFWSAVLSDSNHRLNGAATDVAATIFRTRPTLAKQWMTGELASCEVIHLAGPEKSAKERAALLRCLTRSCRQMRPDPLISQVLRELSKARVVRVLATDNMDCFYDASDAIPELRYLFDVLLCSSELGTLKSECAQRFFGGWLASNGISSADAYLVDDSTTNCSLFRQMGGWAAHATTPSDALVALQELRQHFEAPGASPLTYWTR